MHQSQAKIPTGRHLRAQKAGISRVCIVGPGNKDTTRVRAVSAVGGGRGVVRDGEAASVEGGSAEVGP